MSTGEVAHLGTLLVELSIQESGSLKDKRRVIKSLKDRLRAKFNISVAEIGLLDKWQRCLLGVAAIGNDSRVLESIMSQVLDFISVDPWVVVIDSRIEML